MIINDLYNNKKQDVAEGQLELNTPDPVVVVQDQRGKILDKVNLSVAAQKYKLGQPQNIKNQLAHQNYTKIGNYTIVSPMTGQPQDQTTTGQKTTFATPGMVEDNAGVPVHRIGLTVTDPNHPMVSKRGETIQKTVRVPGADREKAINSAIAHYRRKGYKVHDHHYIGTVDEGRFVRGPGGVPLDRQGRPVAPKAPKAEPMRMRQWVVHHEGQRGEGGEMTIDAPNAETAWELANEYDLDIIDIKPAKGVSEGSFDHWSPMGKDSIHQDRIRSLQNLIAIAKEQGRQLRVQELELALKKLQGVNEVSLGDYRKKAAVSQAGAKIDRFFGRDDAAKVAAADQTIAKRERGLARADARTKPYTPPPAAPADLEKQQRDLTAKYPNIDELVRRAELNRDPDYEMADGQAYYAARDAEQNYLKLKQIQRVIQGLNESLNRSHLP